MGKTDIKNLSGDELIKELIRMGEKPYRANQVFKWLYKVGVKSFNDMTDLSRDLREKLKDKFHITKITSLDSKRSFSDGTTKYLLKLEDSHTIEAVFLPEEDRATVCLSSQVGCKFACSFCASAPFGFVRNLKASEILDEVLFMRELNKGQAITNIVFMGIGEPLDNYNNVMRAIRILNDENAFKIGARKITISTCGIIPGIDRLVNEKLQIELSVSLHSADNKIRSRLVPMNKAYPLEELISTCKNYTLKTKRVITFEYILIRGENASVPDAFKLARLLTGMMCKVNVIVYNQIKAKGYEAPAKEDVGKFIRTLKTRGINVMLRKSKGEDIDAGCGQLRISAQLARPARTFECSGQYSHNSG